MTKLDLLRERQARCVPIRSGELWAVVLKSRSKARSDDGVNYESVGTSVNSPSNQGNRKLEKTKENPRKQIIKANIYSFKHKNKFN